MGNLRSQEKKQKRYSRRDANNLLLNYSFHDRLLAETVHTTETEKKNNLLDRASVRRQCCFQVIL